MVISWIIIVILLMFIWFLLSTDKVQAFVAMHMKKMIAETQAASEQIGQIEKEFEAIMQKMKINMEIRKGEDMREKVEMTYFEINATWETGAVVVHNLNNPFKELYCAADDQRIGFIPVTENGVEDLNSVQLIVPKGVMIDATITINLRAEIEEWAEKALNSEMEAGYRKALNSALTYTQAAIQNGELDQKDYFENVTRSLYYEGWMNRESKMLSDMELQAKLNKPLPEENESTS